MSILYKVTCSDDIVKKIYIGTLCQITEQMKNFVEGLKGDICIKSLDVNGKWMSEIVDEVLSIDCIFMLDIAACEFNKKEGLRLLKGLINNPFIVDLRMYDNSFDKEHYLTAVHVAQTCRNLFKFNYLECNGELLHTEQDYFRELMRRDPESRAFYTMDKYIDSKEVSLEKRIKLDNTQLCAHELVELGKILSKGKEVTECREMLKRNTIVNDDSGQGK